MTLDQKCKDVIRGLLNRVNDDVEVRFETDWEGNTMTVYLGKQRCHVGQADGTFEQLVDDLHALLAAPKLPDRPTVPFPAAVKRNEEEE